jgi:hypothetical protein
MDYIDTIKKKQTVIDVSKEVGLEVNAERTVSDCRARSQPKASQQILRKYETVQIFGNDSNKSKLD